MEITDELVEHLANLSRLSFSSEEKEKFKKDFSNIIEYMDLLNKIDVSDVELNNIKLDAKTQLREDEVKEGLQTSDVVLNAPKSMGGAVVVPTVVEE